MFFLNGHAFVFLLLTCLLSNFGWMYIVAHGTVEHHDEHEKKSVLKKVKAKAKKIKDTITKHGHHDDHEQGHGHDQYQYENQHIPDDHDLDEEDEVDEDPEIHGAPSNLFLFHFFLHTRNYLEKY